jgi:hypothetical protein
MATYVFDEGVPIPTTTVRQGSNIELLKAMKVGQSYWWPIEEQKKATRFYRVAKKLAIGVIIRKVDASDKKGPGVRMWRVDKEAPDPIHEAALEAARKAAAAVKTASLPPRKPPIKKTPAKKVVNGAAPAAKKVATKKPAAKKVKAPAPEIPSTPLRKKQDAAKAATA